MRKWLQKPWVSISLLLVASWIVYTNVLQPILVPQTSAPTTNFIQDITDGMNLTTPTPQEQQPVTITDWEKVKQSVFNPNVVIQDPFRPSPHYIQKKPLRLHAIVIGSGLRYALINQRIMQVGDIIHGMEVTQIYKNSVVVSNKGNSIHLQLNTANKGSK